MQKKLIAIMTLLPLLTLNGAGRADQARTFISNYEFNPWVIFLVSLLPDAADIASVSTSKTGVRAFFDTLAAGHLALETASGAHNAVIPNSPAIENDWAVRLLSGINAGFSVMDCAQYCKRLAHSKRLTRMINRLSSGRLKKIRSARIGNLFKKLGVMLLLFGIRQLLVSRYPSLNENRLSQYLAMSMASNILLSLLLNKGAENNLEKDLIKSPSLR